MNKIFLNGAIIITFTQFVYSTGSNINKEIDAKPTLVTDKGLILKKAKVVIGSTITSDLFLESNVSNTKRAEDLINFILNSDAEKSNQSLTNSPISENEIHNFSVGYTDILSVLPVSAPKTISDNNHSPAAGGIIDYNFLDTTPLKNKLNSTCVELPIYSNKPNLMPLEARIFDYCFLTKYGWYRNTSFQNAIKSAIEAQKSTPSVSEDVLLRRVESRLPGTTDGKKYNDRTGKRFFNSIMSIIKNEEKYSFFLKMLEDYEKNHNHL